MAYVVQIDNNFRDSLDEALDKNNHSGKVRPYYYGVPYKNYMILIPLRSNCPKSYSLRIYNTGGRNRPGLDFCKMLILTKDEVASKTTNVAINHLVLKDLNRKRNQIKTMANKTIEDYRNMHYKVQNKLDLTSDERFLNQRSTVINFSNIILKEES